MRARAAQLDLAEGVELEMALFEMALCAAVRAISRNGQRVIQRTGHAVRWTRNLVAREPAGRDAVDDVVVGSLRDQQRNGIAADRGRCGKRVGAERARQVPAHPAAPLGHRGHGRRLAGLVEPTSEVLTGPVVCLLY